MSQEVAEAKQAEQVVISLSTGAHGDTRVVAVNLTVNAMRICLNALQARSVRAVFRSEVAELIEQVSAWPASCYTAARVLGPSLRCGTLNIIGYSFEGRMEEGRKAVTVRLFHTEGNAMSLFRDIAQDDVPAPGPAQLGECERLFEEMVSQLYLPLADLNVFLNQPVPEPSDDHVLHLTNTVVHLKTRADRLKRAFDRLITQVRTDKLATG